MRTIIICLLLLTFVNVNFADAQNKKIKQDTVYYFIDTTSVPIKDKMIREEIEEPFKLFVLLCRCYPGGTNPAFSSFMTKTDNAKYISIKDFHRLKTISLAELINITVEYAKDGINKHSFFFIEPKRDEMKITKVYLIAPRKPQESLDGNGVEIRPVH